MGDSESLLDWLQEWYAHQCDGDWEHEWGVRIATLDNPGWSVEIDLEETDLEGREYTRLDVRRSSRDWVLAWTAEQTFHAACGPGNLAEVLAVFRTWATSPTS
ncbi:immunity 53 family protein [Streptomyces sp. NPDC049040]|uniref:immunity 53 family protein n=1 Tax=Streptomyces sp. NPDC049040 TaxID=3365593 RepID=UPI003716A4D2